jgi:hypothetical protein
LDRELFFFLFGAGVWPDLQDKVPGGAFSIVYETITTALDKVLLFFQQSLS